MGIIALMQAAASALGHLKPCQYCCHLCTVDHPLPYSGGLCALHVDGNRPSWFCVPEACVCYVAVQMTPNVGCHLPYSGLHFHE